MAISIEKECNLHVPTVRNLYILFYEQVVCGRDTKKEKGLHDE